MQKDVYSQARREEDLRRQLERHDDDLVRARAATEDALYLPYISLHLPYIFLHLPYQVRARAATEDAKAQASMQTRVAEELKTAL